jgi:ankyrin repeat protein
VRLSEFNGDDSDISTMGRTTAFIRASQSGHVAIVKILLKRETHLDQEKTVRFTDLMVASMNGHDDIVKLLKDRGARTGTGF